jgi:hypothetical protein
MSQANLALFRTNMLEPPVEVGLGSPVLALSVIREWDEGNSSRR